MRSGRGFVWLSTYGRSFEGVSGSSSPGDRGASRRTIIRRWDGEAQQVVDVLHQEAVHEQESQLEHLFLTENNT